MSKEIAKQLVDKYIKSFGDTEIPIDEMYYNESKSNGIMMRNFLEYFAEDILEQPKQVESECEVIESNDYNMDIFINKYIRELPKNWRGEVDLYLGMKNAMLEALSYPDKYTIKRNI